MTLYVTGSASRGVPDATGRRTASGYTALEAHAEEPVTPLEADEMLAVLPVEESERVA